MRGFDLIKRLWSLEILKGQTFQTCWSHFRTCQGLGAITSVAWCFQQCAEHPMAETRSRKVGPGGCIATQWHNGVSIQDAAPRGGVPFWRHREIAILDQGNQGNQTLYVWGRCLIWIFWIVASPQQSISSRHRWLKHPLQGQWPKECRTNRQHLPRLPIALEKYRQIYQWVTVLFQKSWAHLLGVEHWIQQPEVVGNPAFSSHSKS